MDLTNYRLNSSVITKYNQFSYIILLEENNRYRIEKFLNSALRYSIEIASRHNNARKKTIFSDLFRLISTFNIN